MVEMAHRYDGMRTVSEMANDSRHLRVDSMNG